MRRATVGNPAGGAKRLGAQRYEAAAALEQAALNELRNRGPDRAIETNVEFWAAR
jgi:citrate synthase